MRIGFVEVCKCAKNIIQKKKMRKESVYYVWFVDPGV